VLTVEDERIVEFEEKPAHPKSDRISMGIYCFKKQVLIDQLVADSKRDTAHDFGSDIIPAMVNDPAMKVYGYPFHGYWRDVGTIEAYYDANMDLLVDLPELDLYEPDTRIRTRATGYPPAKIGRRAYLSRSLLSLGNIVNGHVEHSVLSPGVYIEEGAVVRDSIIFDDCRIESGAIVERSIVDKETVVSKNAYVGYGDDMSPNHDHPDILNCGITIIGKRAKVPPYVRIGRNCVIGSNVVAEGIMDGTIPSGTTLRSPMKLFPYTV
jgi:glucose-1-phosphate adenylyltransferase